MHTFENLRFFFYLNVHVSVWIIADLSHVEIADDRGSEFILEYLFHGLVGVQ